MLHRVFPSKPLEHPLAKQYMAACKSSHLEDITTFLSSHRYLVYEFDALMMTGLHWACKRGLTEVAQKLLYRGADPDAQDIVARTPMYIALDHGFNEIIKV